jgi:hypothetical protein
MSLLALATKFLWVALVYELVSWLIRIARRPQRDGSAICNDFTEASVWLGYLVHYGLDGGFVQFVHKRSGRFLRFRKHIRERNDHRISLDIPAVGWRDEDVAMLRAYCKANGFALETPSNSKKGGKKKGNTDRFLVDCSDAADQAYDLALTIWTKVFHARAKTAHRRDVSGVTVMLPGARILGWFFTVFAIALPVTVLLTIGAYPDWSISIGPVSLKGSMAGLIVFTAYLIFLVPWALRGRPPYLVQHAILRFYDAGRRLIAIVLPAVVVLIWAGVLDDTHIAIGSGSGDPADAGILGIAWDLNTTTVLGAVGAGFLWVVLALLGVALVCLFAQPGKKGRRAPERLFPKIKQWLNELLLNSDEGIHLLITHGQSGRFIRFRKYAHEDGGEGLTLAFTGSGDGEGLSSLQKYCEKHGLPVSVTVLPGAEQTPCFQIDCGRNLDRAARMARRVWREIFGLAANANYDSRIGHSRQDGFDGQPAGQFARLREWLEDAAPYAFLVSLIALPVATLLTIGDPPDWSLSGASGSAASLACFIVYLITLATWLSRKNDTGEPGPREFRPAFIAITLPLITLLLPVSVVLVWAGA